jgi:hypothetical protein
MNPKIYSNLNNYLIIYTPKVIPWGQTDKQTNGQTNKQMDGWTNIYSIFRDKLSLPHGSSDNNNSDVAFVNKIGDTEIIHNSCGTGPDVHVDNQLGMGDVIGDIDNGSPSSGLDNGCAIGWLTNIEPREFAAVGNVGGGHLINNNHFDVAVVNNVNKN